MGCIACGACCTHLMLEVPEDHHGLHRWLELHGGKVVKRYGRTLVDLPIACQELVGGRCRSYRGRPELCRRAFCEQAAEEMGCEIVWLEEGT